MSAPQDESAQQSGLVVENLTKSALSQGKSVDILNGVNFAAKAGEFYTLLGPSGCGKTTTLRCVAGLEHHQGGRIRIGGRTVSGGKLTSFLPPQARNVGMVFQSYAIWPHMSVYQNAAFPLQVRGGVPNALIKQRVEEALAVVHLAGLEDRNATQLSGGQQQRLALARAIVHRPKLLLLDEPLSNLDAKLRDSMRTELRDLQQKLGITALYVTHDQTEALSMSDRVAVMRNGRIEQEGAPESLYHQPTSRFIAEFMGGGNFIDVHVTIQTGGDGTKVGTGIGVVCARNEAAGTNGRKIVVTIRPENILLHKNNPNRANTFPGTMEKVTFVGGAFSCIVRIGDTPILILYPLGRSVAAGDSVFVELPPEHCSIIVDD